MNEPSGENKAIRFDEQVVVITGAGRGLGREYALAFAAKGAKIVVQNRTASSADEVVEEIRNAGGEAVASYDAITTPEGGQAIIDKAVNAFGRVDVLVNNAGFVQDKSFVKMPLEVWKDNLDVHLNAAFYLCQPAVRCMREQGYGRILLTSSSASLYGNFGQTNYAAAKMGLIGLMNALKQEVKKYDIKINAVSPTALTGMTKGLFPEQLAELSDPLMVTPMILLLCSKSCPESGQIFRAGLGHFARVAFVTAKGAVLKGETAPTPEDVLAAMDAISDLTDGVEIENTTFSLKHALNALGIDFDGMMRPGK